MYGKKRIVIQKNNCIVLAGGGSWFPIGFIKVLDDSIRATIVKPLFIYRYPRDENNFEDVYVPNKKTLKELVSKEVFYAFEKSIDEKTNDPNSQFYSLVVDGVENAIVENINEIIEEHEDDLLDINMPEYSDRWEGTD